MSDKAPDNSVYGFSRVIKTLYKEENNGKKYCINGKKVKILA